MKISDRRLEISDILKFPTSPTALGAAAPPAIRLCTH